MTASTGIMARLTLGALLSIGIVVVCGSRMAEAFLPVLRWSLVQLNSVDRVVDLSIRAHGVISGDEQVYWLVVAPDRLVFIGDRPVFADPRGRAMVSVLVTYLFQSLIVALPFALAWPASSGTQWLVRLAALSAFLGCFTLIDLPFALWAQIWQIYVDTHAPGKFSLLLVWADFLQGGGRFLLGFIAAGMSVVISRSLFRLP